jgi:hypothetical protein
LVENGELTIKAQKVFENIFNSFAIDGRMGINECSNFVAGVTKTCIST